MSDDSLFAWLIHANNPAAPTLLVVVYCNQIHNSKSSPFFRRLIIKVCPLEFGGHRRAVRLSCEQQLIIQRRPHDQLLTGELTLII